MNALIFLSAILALASASCPNLTTVNPFNVTKFAGTWYNQFSRNTPLEGGSCMVSNYTYDSDAEVMTVNTTYKTLLGNIEKLSSYADLSNSSDGTFTLVYSTPIGDMKFGMNILATDYDNYVVMFSCMNVLLVPYESSWILTKAQVVDEAVLKAIEEAMIKVHESGGPSFAQMKKDSQDNCS